ncbi:hypothetical protein GCK72_003175 [Caenorhabditis remanei]|uniref:F-box domain-containing protein n=1 Tax=Caenorhabditis remanei TaxID=31234 RepID=A0A6A5HUC5_CAERE|nr:hypothetical protein GCK72_003175 [Caenorhabditis remanei]KAF1771349.1 hypothetical protein GCK72_003175 [Caenorhabditis remanei]
MSSPFPLLRLPRLVLCEVFKSLNIGEKIKLSFCSKKISIQINNARLYSQKVTVDLDMFHQIIKVLSENKNDTFEIFNCWNYEICNKPNSIKIEGRAVSVIFYNKAINAFWKNHQKGFLSVLRPVFTSWPQKIYIMSSAWFTLKYLLTCTTCTRITLGGSLLENHDLDETLWKWQTGGFPNLEFMKIHGRNITNNGTTILGMKLRELDRLVIQTNDGSKKATIKTGYGQAGVDASQEAPFAFYFDCSSGPDGPSGPQ